MIVYRKDDEDDVARPGQGGVGTPPPDPDDD